MRRCRHIAVLFAGLLLAGCAEQAVVSPPPPEEPPAPPPTIVEEAPPELIPPVPPPKPPVPKLPEKAPAPTPAELIGLDRDGVIRLLGDPAEERSEGAARVFTYRGKKCQFDVIFFLDVKTGTERVLSFEEQAAAAKHPASCYPSLRVIRQ